jgi:long-chain fatty acid transport protein
VRWDRGDASHWRFGFYWDESPQPTESVSPVLPDADRLGYCVGWGREWGDLAFDVALLYVDFEQRTTTTSRDGFYGTYTSDVLLLGTSFGW